MVSINKQTKFCLNKEMNNKKSNLFTPCYQMKILFFQLEHSFLNYQQKMKKNVYNMSSSYFTKNQQATNLQKKQPSPYSSLIYIFHIKHNCIITIDVSLTIY